MREWSEEWIEEFERVENVARRCLDENGWRVFPTGQTVAPTLERWSPDFWCSAGFWCDAKTLTPGFEDFILEKAEILRHLQDFPPTVYLFVGRDDLSFAGWISADDAWMYHHDERSRHYGGGSGTPYIVVSRRRLKRPDKLEEAWS